MDKVIPYLTLIVSLSVATISCLQWRLAQSKLRLDLFDRRYKVFAATRKFLGQIIQTSRVDNLSLFQFELDTSDKEFLFGSDVVDYLTEIRDRAIDSQNHHGRYEHLPVSDERTRHVEAEMAQLIWLNNQTKAITKNFVPYLGFSQVK